MRVRAATIMILLLLPLAALVPAHAAGDRGIVVSQERQDPEEEGVLDDSDEVESENVDEQGEGGAEPESETGAGEGETESAEEEAGPVWTYQMVWLSLGLLLLLGLGVARWYYLLVGRRQRHGV